MEKNVAPNGFYTAKDYSFHFVTFVTVPVLAFAVYSILF